MDVAVIAGIIMIISVVVMLVMGVPIGISIGMSSALAMITILPFGPGIVTCAQKMFTGVNSFSLLAIPFFILAGNIMNNGGIAIRLVNCARLISGCLPGSLAQTNIVANMLFGAISGSGTAAAAAIGGTMAPIELEEGYDKDYVAAVNIASAPTGQLIPPSNTLIVYATVAGSGSRGSTFPVHGRLHTGHCLGYFPDVYCGIHGKKEGVRVNLFRDAQRSAQGAVGCPAQPALNYHCNRRYSERRVYCHGRFCHCGGLCPDFKPLLPLPENKRPAVHYIEFLQDHLYCYFYDWRVIHHVMGHGLYHDSHCHCQRHAVPQQQ